jgi:hypothetical protein
MFAAVSSHFCRSATGQTEPGVGSAAHNSASSGGGARFLLSLPMSLNAIDVV